MPQPCERRASYLTSPVSEWWYFAVLIAASGFGFAGVAGWPTFTTPGVVPYGVALSMIFVIPVGIIKAMTGIEVTLNVLAEFIGGMWVQGNAVRCAHLAWPVWLFVEARGRAARLLAMEADPTCSWP